MLTPTRTCRVLSLPVHSPVDGANFFGLKKLKHIENK